MKYQGTVKWFSNKKGFGFIAPTSDDAPTTDEIFVHQTAIVTNGAYRTLSVRPVDLWSLICDVMYYFLHISGRSRLGASTFGPREPRVGDDVEPPAVMAMAFVVSPPPLLLVLNRKMRKFSLKWKRKRTRESSRR